MRRAEVLLNDRPVGRLEELEGGYRFTYHQDYLKDPLSPPVVRLIGFLMLVA